MSTEAVESSWVPSDTFGSRLYLIRREKRLTVEQAAKAAGLAPATWSTWEAGAKPRDLVTVVQKINSALGADRDYLMWGTVGGGSIRT